MLTAEQAVELVVEKGKQQLQEEFEDIYTGHCPPESARERLYDFAAGFAVAAEHFGQIRGFDVANVAWQARDAMIEWLYSQVGRYGA